MVQPLRSLRAFYTRQTIRSMSVISKKICMIGDFSVGKTSLIRRYLDRQFSDHYLSTIGVKISRKELNFSTPEAGETICKLMIWDIEGKTEFQSITPSYVAGAKGAIIVADLNRPDTIDHIQKHLDLIRSNNPGGTAIAIALNKSDTLSRERTQSIVDSIQLTQRYSVRQIYITSAKTGDAVEEMFEWLAHSLLEKHSAQHSV
jgi:small GTP-binding protein